MSGGGLVGGGRKVGPPGLSVERRRRRRGPPRCLSGPGFLSRLGRAKSPPKKSGHQTKTRVGEAFWLSITWPLTDEFFVARGGGLADAQQKTSRLRPPRSFLKTSGGIKSKRATSAGQAKALFFSSRARGTRIGRR